MDQVIVTLDGKDHKIGYGEHTMCMLPVPHGSTREEGAKECKTCFAADPLDEPAEEVFALNTAEPEPAADEPVEAEFTEEPAKPVKAATKRATKAK